MKKSKFSNRLILLIIGFVVLGGLYYKTFYLRNSLNNLKTNIIPAVVKKVIGSPDTKFSVDKVKETNGVYEFELTLGEAANSQKYTSYITKDGKILFTSGVKIDSLDVKGTQDTKETKKLTCNDVKKADQPNLTAYIVANCPYGLQMQRVFNKAITEQPELSKYLTVRYIGSVVGDKITSMHDQDASGKLIPGGKEATENLKQICIREEQPETYWPYVACYMQAGDTEGCNAAAGVDTTTLQSCMTDSNKGIAYAKKDFALANKFKVQGSPTLISNDEQTVSEFDFGGRVANAIQQLVCCASRNKPGFCETALSADPIASSFSESQTGTDGSNSAASCGN